MTLDELKQHLNDELNQNKNAEEQIHQSNEEIAKTFLKIQEYESILAKIQSIEEEWLLINNSEIVFSNSDTSINSADSVYMGNARDLDTIEFSRVIGSGKLSINFMPYKYEDTDYYKPAAYELKISMLNIRYKLILIHESQAEELRRELGIDEGSSKKSNIKAKLAERKIKYINQ